MDKLPNELLLNIFEFVFSYNSPLSTIIINKHLVNIQNKVKTLMLLSDIKYILHKLEETEQENEQENEQFIITLFE